MSIWDTVAAPIIAIINKVVPDKAAAAAAVASLQQMQMQGALQEEMAQLQAITSAQSDVDKIEAASTDKFTSRWRPFIGWICGCGLAVQFLVGPLFTWIVALTGPSCGLPAARHGDLVDPARRYARLGKPAHGREASRKGVATTPPSA
jgi:roadblock/LC7 domain-containing protein